MQFDNSICEVRCITYFFPISRCCRRHPYSLVCCSGQHHVRVSKPMENGFDDTTWNNYRKTADISRTLAGNKMVDNSDAVGAAPVGAAPIASSFSTQHLTSMDWAKTTARGYKKQVSFGFGATYTRCFTVSKSKNSVWQAVDVFVCVLSIKHTLIRLFHIYNKLKIREGARNVWYIVFSAKWQLNTYSMVTKCVREAHINDKRIFLLRQLPPVLVSHSVTPVLPIY